MSKSTNNGWPAVATTASGSGASVEEVPPARGFFPSLAATPLLPNPANPVVATPFNAMPPTPSSSRGRGRNPSRTPYHSRSSNAPRRPPQEPQLPVTLGQGGRILPNSDAELAAYDKAMVEVRRVFKVRNFRTQLGLEKSKVSDSDVRKALIYTS
jgi:hypothetical protein